AEVYEVALAVRDVGAAVAYAPHPRVVVEPPRHLNIRAAHADAVGVDAGEVRLAADARAEAAVERVIPDVQLPRGGRVGGGDEVHHALGHVNDVLVRADAVEGRHLVVRQLVGLDLEAPAR